MYLIIALGNPGENYSKTKHNAGFLAGDFLQTHRNLPPFSREKKRNSYVTQGNISNKNGNIPLIIIKPQSFMNNSGGPSQQVSHFFKIPPENIIVIHDDIDLPLATITYKSGGGHAGHNGLKSIINEIGSKDFKRIRIGVGRPNNADDVVDYVLSNFSLAEFKSVTDQFFLIDEKLQHHIFNT